MLGSVNNALLEIRQIPYAQTRNQSKMGDKKTKIDWYITATKLVWRCSFGSFHFSHSFLRHSRILFVQSSSQSCCKLYYTTFSNTVCHTFVHPVTVAHHLSQQTLPFIDLLPRFGAPHHTSPHLICHAVASFGSCRRYYYYNIVYYYSCYCYCYYHYYVRLSLAVHAASICYEFGFD